MTGYNCSLHIGPRIFRQFRARNNGYFFLVTGARVTSITLRVGAYKIVHYPEMEKRLLGALLKMAGLKFLNTSSASDKIFSNILVLFGTDSMSS